MKEFVSPVVSPYPRGQDEQTEISGNIVRTPGKKKKKA